MGSVIKWGILGTGRIAKKFAEDLQYVQHAQLIAVGSRSQQSADVFASQFQLAKSYDSYEALVQDAEVDVIYIATPHVFHYENTLLCLHHNKAVLCEKPFAMNRKQVAGMIETARRKNVFLMEALWTKFLPHYHAMMELVANGTIGEVVAVQANFGFKTTEQSNKRLTEISLGGGTLLDIGIYNVFMALSVLGKPAGIEAAMKKSVEGVDEQCAITFTYNNGAMAQLFSTFNATIPIEVHLFGSKGNLKLSHRFYEPSCEIFVSEHSGSEYKKVEVAKTQGTGYEYEAQHVTDCLLKGLKESPVLSFDDSLLLIETLDAIRNAGGLVYEAD
ncbi:MAG: Gfo/Idh/MocA family oxidoreductase [Bacteroidota bacterium]|nr:Gfo/Idh/MocA family oxidoreductase [Bacteroidota bacterium]